MAKETKKKQLLISCNAEGKKGATPFTRTFVDGKTETFWVELNVPTDVTDRPWVYDIWVNSYWNANRVKNSNELERDKNIISSYNESGNCEGVIE